MKITNEIFYTSFDIEGSGTAYNDFTIQSRFSFQYLKAHTLLQFDLLRDGLLHFAAGVSEAVVLKDKEWIRVANPQGVEGNRFFVSKPFELGMVGGLGMKLGKVTADIRYEKSGGISDYWGLSGKTTRVYFFVKYRLSKKGV